MMAGQRSHRDSTAKHTKLGCVRLSSSCLFPSSYTITSSKQNKAPLQPPHTYSSPKTAIMPRNGDGSSDNGPIEAGANIGHGVPQSVRSLTSTPSDTEYRG